MQAVFFINLFPQNIIDYNHNIFCRRVQAFKLCGVFIQIFMVETLQYVFINQIAQQFQIVHIPGGRVWLAS